MKDTPRYGRRVDLGSTLGVDWGASERESIGKVVVLDFGPFVRVNVVISV